MSCVYGTTTTVRLKQQGMEFAVWVFKHADNAQLQPHSNVILQKLLQLLNEGTSQYMSVMYPSFTWLHLYAF